MELKFFFYIIEGEILYHNPSRKKYLEILGNCVYWLSAPQFNILPQSTLSAQTPLISLLIQAIESSIQTTIWHRIHTSKRRHKISHIVVILLQIFHHDLKISRSILLPNISRNGQTDEKKKNAAIKWENINIYGGSFFLKKPPDEEDILEQLIKTYTASDIAGAIKKTLQITDLGIGIINSDSQYECICKIGILYVCHILTIFQHLELKRFHA